MPEYLAPGVYVEEIPSGNMPIQAASTSTAGMVGCTQRGPVGVPTLVTSYGGYSRIFGGRLAPDAFPGGLDALPYAVEGFFANGGSRLFVVRVTGPDAAASRGIIPGRWPVVVSSAVAAGETQVELVNVDGLAAGDILTVGEEDLEIVAVAAGAGTVTLAQATTVAIAAGATGIASGAAFAVHARWPGAWGDDLRATVAAAKTPTLDTRIIGAAEAGDSEVRLATVAGLSPGSVIALEVPAVGPPVVVTATAQSADPVNGTVTLTESLVVGVAAGATVTGTRPPLQTTVAADAAAGDSAVQLLVVDGLSPGAVVVLDGHEATVVAADAATGIVTLADPLADPVAAGAVATSALPPLETTVAVDATAGDSQVRLVSVAGLAPDSELVLTAQASARQRQFVTVERTDAATGTVSLARPLAGDVEEGDRAISQEFSLLVERIERDRAVESEFFDHLSLARAHPRFVGGIVGAWSNGRPAEVGGSNLVRVSSPAGGPPNGTTALQGLPLSAQLSGGRDDADGVDGDAFKGTASEDPEDRTGIEALANEPTISLVAVPGCTDVDVQQALLIHCEQMRYRFAVLDIPLGAKLADARRHRQNFDSTRAALYYPGLLIPDGFGRPGEKRAIFPSGHMLGVYARTDTTRGVHKAPANEVVRGILGFETKLTQGEQSILNPLNLNCSRDFREENRGLRVYGARVATSDPELRYINVRRLLLFIEQSLDTGLQWAVHEPNSEPLWAAVKQSITGFLTTVWRSGALVGTTAEEAFFVKIGYGITMWQEEIDNGQLIAEVGVAPVKPAEFVIVRISQKTREATA
ncbi:MAG TPA: phage tail sheath subtilisin-like domain-containing protein [Arachnia sp.]|nr:phage tail sheath subtilisin-like domain-containing protein [Arachnia sp.]HMT85312.1 phage tail sheath subtilisin-like domain-containing protein [Arachnia sp.]